MKSSAINLKESFEPDGFHVGRVKALQPHLQPSELCEDVMATEDPRVTGYLTNVLRLWSQSRHDLPHTFAEELQVTRVVRQPLAIIVAQVQHIHRSISPIEEPYAGGQVDASQWRTRDRFQMQPVTPAVFPAQEQIERFDLPGREKVESCGNCMGARQSTCLGCGGLGTVNCDVCGGTQRRICPRCEGGGTHLGTSGRYIQCQVCRTRGTVKCDSCSKGQVRCADCVGGQVTCQRCAGYGQTKQRWVLTTRISTLETRRLYVREPWPLELSTIHGDLDEAARREWEWPMENPPTAGFDGELPDELQRVSNDAIEAALREHPVLDPDGHRITGLRATVLGTYVYEVDFTFRERPEKAYVCGSTNRVFTRREAIRAPTLFNKIAKLSLRLYDKAFVTGGIEFDHGYLTAVREGRAHLADSKCLIPAVTQLIKVRADVTDSGYLLDIPAPQSTGATSSVRFHVDFDVDASNRSVVSIHHTLGNAKRERFPQALESNRSLAFGRIALVDTPGTGQELFEYIDCRLYESAKPQQLAMILKAMTAEVTMQLTKQLIQ